MRTIMLAAASLLALLVPARAETASGELRCSVAGGIGYVVVGKRATSCVYYRRDGRVEFYIGYLGKLGLDFGPTNPRQAAFTVVTRDPEPVGLLEGDFVGAGAGITVGAGGTGDGLIGGRDQTVQIVPLANSRLTGLNVNLGIGDLHLRYAGTEGRRPAYRARNPDDID